MNDLQKQEIYDQLYEEDIVYKSDSALVLLEKMQIAISLNDSTRDQAALMLYHGNFGDVQSYRHSCKNPNRSQVKGSYYVVNRVLYSYDYATSVYEKKKYAALTQNIEIHHYSISPNSRDNSLFKQLLIEKKRGPITTTYFPHYFSF
jgi:hypothetical protein